MVLDVIWKICAPCPVTNSNTWQHSLVLKICRAATFLSALVLRTASRREKQDSLRNEVIPPYDKPEKAYATPRGMNDYFIRLLLLSLCRCSELRYFSSKHIRTMRHSAHYSCFAMSLGRELKAPERLFTCPVCVRVYDSGLRPG